MPRNFPAGLNELLARPNRNIETHSTLTLFVPNEATTISYFFATANLVIRGVPFLGLLRETSAARSSLTRTVDRAELTIANEDTVFGRELIDIQEGLFGTEVRLGRYWRDVDSGVEFQRELLQGVVAGVDVNENVIKLSLVSDAYAAASIGASRRVTKSCQWRFRDPLTCGYAGAELVCNFLLNDTGGCQGRHGDPLKRAKYGGFAYIESKASVTAGEGQSVPAYNQLIKSEASPQSNHIQSSTLLFGSGFKVNNNIKQKRTEVFANAVQAISIKAFGAVGDGVTDDSFAIQAALNFKGRLFIPPGIYTFGTTLTLPDTTSGQSLILEGAGSTESILRYTGTGNAISGNNLRNDHMIFMHFKVESNHASNTGDGFNFTGLAGVQTRVTIDDLAIFGFGGWGIFSLNYQSGIVSNCHIRDCTKGAIAFEDDNLGEFSREPNTNRIVDCLLDNSVANAANVAMVRLFNSNETLISGLTIQGHWIGGTGNDPAIWVEQSRGVALHNIHIEAGSTVTAAGIYISNTKGVLISSCGGTGQHTTDIQIVASRGVIIHNGRFQTSESSNLLVDAASRNVTVIGGVWSNPANLTRGDQSPDGVLYINPSFHSQVSTFRMEIFDSVRDSRISAKKLLTNGDFATDTSSWLGTATGITRVASGTVPFDGPYVLCNTQALADGGQVGSSNFYQEYSIPNSFPSGVYTLYFKFFIESLGTGTDVTNFVDVEFTGAGMSGSTAFRINNQDPLFQINRSYTCKLTDKIDTGTSRVIRVNINPTTGPATPRVRFAEFDLVQGTEALREFTPTTGGGGSGLPDPVGTGIVVKTASGPTTTATRTLEAGQGIGLNNASGVGGNPTIFVNNDTTTQRVSVRKNSGAEISAGKRRLNFIEGSNVTLTVTEDNTDNEIDVTIAASGGAASGIDDCVVSTATSGSVGDDNPTTLHSVSPGASYLANDNDFIEVTVAGINANTATSKRVEYLYAGVAIFDTGHVTTSLDNKHWKGEATIIRLSSTTARAICHFQTSDNGSGTISWANNIVTTSFSATHSNNNAFAVRATSGSTSGTGANDDLVQYITTLKRGLA